MEGEREEQGESAQSGTTSPPTQRCSEESDEQQNLQEPEEEDGGAEIGACNGEVWEDLWVSDAETSPRETRIANCLPLCPMPTEVERTPPSLASHPSNTQNVPSEPCWYCLRSLDSEHRPESPQQEDSSPLSLTSSSGQKVNYQTDPRPHFGVAWSSHSTCRPLWGSEGPCWGQRNQDMPDQTHACPHCHLEMPPDTLRWHEAKCLLFEGVRNPKT